MGDRTKKVRERLVIDIDEVSDNIRKKYRALKRLEKVTNLFWNRYRLHGGECTFISQGPIYSDMSEQVSNALGKVEGEVVLCKTTGYDISSVVNALVD